MKWRMVRVFLWLLVSAVVVGCGGDDDGPAPGPTGGGYNPTLGPAVLEVVGEPTRTLKYNASTDLTVQYKYESGGAIAGEALTYEISDAQAESKLAALSTVTDGNGQAIVPLTAGAVDESFTVTVSTSHGESVVFNIGVTDRSVGSITLTMTYQGVGTFDSFVPFLYEGGGCASINPESLPTANTLGQPVSNLTDHPAFTLVDARDDYMVVITAELAGEVTAFGCMDSITVTEGNDTPVTIALSDLGLPNSILGTYDLDNQFDFGATLPDSVQSIVAILDEMTDDQDIDGNDTTQDYGQDPGAFLTDFLIRQTCRWECSAGEDFDTCSELNHPFGDMSALYKQNLATWDDEESRFPTGFGGCAAWEVLHETVQNMVNQQIATYVPDAVLAFATLSGDMARSIREAKIKSELIVSESDRGTAPMSHKLLTMDVVLHDLQNVEQSYTINLADVGLASLEATGAVTINGNLMQIPEHEFELSYGKLVHYIYQTLALPLFGYTSTGNMFQSWINCVSVGAAMEAQFSVPFVDYEELCNTALSLAGAYVDNKLQDSIDTAGTLTLQGTCTAADIQDGVAQTLADGSWSGTWGESGNTGNVSGTFTGSRRP